MVPTPHFIMAGIIGPAQFTLLLIPLILAIIPLIFYLLTLQNTLKEVSIENRKMQPGEVWLMLVPVFGYIWQFFIVTRMADSLSAEFKTKGIVSRDERPGYAVGLTYCILMVASGPVAFMTAIFGSLISIAGLVFWIIYWVKIDGYKGVLQAN